MPRTGLPHASRRARPAAPGRAAGSVTWRPALRREPHAVADRLAERVDLASGPARARRRPARRRSAAAAPARRARGRGTACEILQAVLAVGDGVVHLLDERALAVLDPVDDVELPQRAGRGRTDRPAAWWPGRAAGASSPAPGRATWRMWWSRSTSATSTHTGGRPQRSLHAPAGAAGGRARRPGRCAGGGARCRRAGRAA